MAPVAVNTFMYESKFTTYSMFKIYLDDKAMPVKSNEHGIVLPVLGLKQMREMECRKKPLKKVISQPCLISQVAAFLILGEICTTA